MVAGLAKKSGFRKVRVMVAGEPGWDEAGYATYASDDFVRHGDPLLIDLRRKDADRVGRIPGSVSIPLAMLEAAAAHIPARAPVVLYGANAEQALQGLQILRRKGVDKVSLVEGNLDGWTRRGGVLVRGAPVTAMGWRNKLPAGGVSPADFRKIVTGKSRGLLLDVRTDEETTAGMLPRARHIPLEHLVARMNELPRHEQIFVYSASGPRAEMARRLLAAKGFDCRYLAARVICSGGRCDIRE